MWVNLMLCAHRCTLTRRQILDSSKLKEFANDNFKFDENGRKLSKSLQAISSFPTVFSKACFPGLQKASLCGNGLRNVHSKINEISLHRVLWNTGIFCSLFLARYCFLETFFCTKLLIYTLLHMWDMCN